MFARFNYTHDAEGQITNWTQQTGTESTNLFQLEYDAADQLLGAVVKAGGPAGSILKQYVYGYDKAGTGPASRLIFQWPPRRTTL
jgi:YD repeat-containing protein